MNTMTTQVREPTVTLPEGAPLVRITAGAGTAGQKTWNLRRPVTLIGSRRPAHIVLHDKNISPAHCVIVNTGTCILIKDLHTSAGTKLNKSLIDLSVLSDGDIIAVGNMNIQVAIQVPENPNEDSSVGLEYENPTKFIKPVSVESGATDQQWDIEDAVVMLGCHKNAYIHLDHELVSSRHAILFRFQGVPAVFDLGGRNGLRVNDQPCSITFLYDEDYILIGQFQLTILAPDSPNESKTKDPRKSTVLPDEEFKQRMGQLAEKKNSRNLATKSTDGDSVSKGRQQKQHPTVEDINTDISESWDKLNSWKSRLEKNATALNKQETNITNRMVELEEKDASIRGQLHDISRLQEEVQEAERKVAKEKVQIQSDREAIAKAQKQRTQQELELKRRLVELQRREKALSSHYSSLQNTNCSHCGEPIDAGSLVEQLSSETQEQH